MADVSKMVADRVAISRTVLSSLDVHGSEIAADLSKLLFPKGLPKALTIELLLEAIHGSLSKAATELASADIANAQELADDDAPRAARDAAVAELRDQLISLRGTFSSVYGPAILKAYGLTGETPDDPELLLHRALNAATHLEDRPITEKPKQAGVTVDAKALAHALRTAVKHLRTSLSDVHREEREAQLTLKRRNEAMASWNARYQGVADMVTGMFELAGRADLAELVRPTARRRAGLTEQGDVDGGTATPGAPPTEVAEPPAGPA